jgi:hypothetical protein
MNNNGYGGFSNSNNENNLERNAKRRKNNSQLPLVTAAMGAARAAKAAANKAAANKAAANKAAANKAAANKAAANKAAANKAAANKAAANKAVARNRVPLVNLKAKRKAAAAAAQAANAANARARNIANRKRRITNLLSTLPTGNFKNNAMKKISNVISNNTKTTALLTQIKNEKNRINAAARNAARAEAKAAANKAKANANARANTNLLNLKNLKDILEFKLTKPQLVDIAKSLGKKPKSKDTVPTLVKMIMANNKNIEQVKKQLNRNTESIEITQKVNSYISSIPNTNRIRPEYTASLVSLFIKDLPIDVRTKILSSNYSKLPEIMKGINQRCIPSTPIDINKNISREEFTDLVFIMWLDGVHDKYITKTLNTWFNDTTLFSQKQKELIVQGWNTPFIRIITSLKLTSNSKNILTSSLSNFPAQWEKKIKIYLSGTKYKNNATNYKFQTRIAKRVSTRKPQNINIAIDQEYTDSNEQSITRFIKNHTRATNSTTDVNTLITYGQAFDPGRKMVGGGVHEDLEMLTQNRIPNNYISDTKKYYLCDLNINLVVGNTPVYKIRVKKDSSNNVNMSFNSKKIIGGVTAGQAKSAKGDILPVSKYFGDALQYFYIAAMNDVERSRKTERFFFGSGDSMALLGYDRVCKILNNPVRMVIDFPSSSNPTIHVVGLDATITNRPQPAASVMTGTAEKNNKNGEVTSNNTKRGR